jgi:hypothetical protein
VAQTTVAGTTVAEVMAELATLEDLKFRRGGRGVRAPRRQIQSRPTAWAVAGPASYPGSDEVTDVYSGPIIGS